jgi:hypothetical protein
MSQTSIARILIVDDEAAQMQALCDTLHDHGYETVGVTTGEAALSTLREREFDLLLTDLIMPGMDGIALLRQALGAVPDLVGIIITGRSSITTAVEAMKSGAFDYILKPFKLSVILPVLSRALGVQRLRLEKVALEQHLHQRTAELEAVNKELESFCYAVSHDLRAPLRSIAGFASALSEEYLDRLDAPGQDYVQRVITAAQRMDHLIDDLLNLSRVTRAEFFEQNVDLSAIARDVVDELRRSSAERQVQVLIDDGIRVSGDARLLRIALENLLGNAWKFTANKPVAHIEVGCQTSSDGQLVCVVRDDGAGFDMTYANKLFGAFQRLHSATQFPGTGIGLATVQRIIHRHGGRIWAEAKVNEGATFSFTFPSLRQAGSAA